MTVDQGASAEFRDHPALTSLLGMAFDGRVSSQLPSRSPIGDFGASNAVSRGIHASWPDSLRGEGAMFASPPFPHGAGSLR